MSAQLWKDLADSQDRRPIVVATLARELRLELLSGSACRDRDKRVAPGASRVADLHPTLWERAERIRSMAIATVELDVDASANALELMSREVTRMLEALVMAADLSSGHDPSLPPVLPSSDSGTWLG